MRLQNRSVFTGCVGVGHLDTVDTVCAKCGLGSKNFAFNPSLVRTVMYINIHVLYHLYLLICLICVVCKDLNVIVVFLF